MSDKRMKRDSPHWRVAEVLGTVPLPVLDVCCDVSMSMDGCLHAIDKLLNSWHVPLVCFAGEQGLYVCTTDEGMRKIRRLMGTEVRDA